MPVGTVKWFDIKRGFGFIVDEGGQDIFVHYSVIEGGGFRRLIDNEQVEYEPVRGPKGICAARVRRLAGEKDAKPKIGDAPGDGLGDGSGDSPGGAGEGLSR